MRTSSRSKGMLSGERMVRKLTPAQSASRLVSSLREVLSAGRSAKRRLRRATEPRPISLRKFTTFGDVEVELELRIERVGPLPGEGETPLRVCNSVGDALFLGAPRLLGASGRRSPVNMGSSAGRGALVPALAAGAPSRSITSSPMLGASPASMTTTPSGSGATRELVAA